MEQATRRVPNPSRLDYYIYSEYLKETDISKLIDLDVYMFEHGKEIMYVISDSEISREEYYERYKIDIPLSIYKLPRGFEWREMGSGPNVVYVNLSDKELFCGDKKDAEIVEHLCKTFSLELINE